MSIARKQRRGKVDHFGRPIPKRLFNNSKRTKGVQAMSGSKQQSYQEMKARLKYLVQLANAIKDKGDVLTQDNFKEVIRKYDKDIFIDRYELELMINHNG